MTSDDSAFTASGSFQLPTPSRLTSSLASLSHTGIGGDDLSISELSINDQPDRGRPFSLLAKPSEKGFMIRDGGEIENEELEEGERDTGKNPRGTSRTREEKLHNDLFVLRRLNAVFGAYNEALMETQSGTDVRKLH